MALSGSVEELGASRGEGVAFAANAIASTAGPGILGADYFLALILAEVPFLLIFNIQSIRIVPSICGDLTSAHLLIRRQHTTQCLGSRASTCVMAEGAVDEGELDEHVTRQSFSYHWYVLQTLWYCMHALFTHSSLVFRRSYSIVNPETICLRSSRSPFTHF